MQRLKTRFIFCALLAMCAAAQAQSTADTSPNCGRLNASFRNAGGADNPVTWTTHIESPATAVAGAYKIAVWGDSLTSSRDFIDAALTTSGLRKELAQPSFIQAGFNVPGISLPLKASCASAGWKTAFAHKDVRNTGAFSKGFLSMTSDTPNDVILLDFRTPSPSTRVRQLNIEFNKKQPQALLVLGVSVDGGDETLISLRKTADANLQIRPQAPMATLKIRLVAGEITLHGFEPQYQDAPALVVDTLSVPGSVFKSWTTLDARYFPDMPPALPAYDLILLQYGTNEGVYYDFDQKKYLEYLRVNLRQVRKYYPTSRCFLIGPPDRGVPGSTSRTDASKYARAHQQIALAQRQAGAEFRCGFWDWQSAMGGSGAASVWAKMTPPQMQQDLTHLTAKGYEASGRMFATSFPLNKH